MDPRHHGTVGRLPRVSASSAADARLVREAHGLKEEQMAVPTLEELTRYRWSSDDYADKFSVENTATRKVINVVHGANATHINPAHHQAPHPFHPAHRR